MLERQRELPNAIPNNITAGVETPVNLNISIQVVGTIHLDLSVPYTDVESFKVYLGGRVIQDLIPEEYMPIYYWENRLDNTEVATSSAGQKRLTLAYDFRQAYERDDTYSYAMHVPQGQLLTLGIKFKSDSINPSVDRIVLRSRPFGQGEVVNKFKNEIMRQSLAIPSGSKEIYWRPAYADPHAFFHSNYFMVKDYNFDKISILRDKNTIYEFSALDMKLSNQEYGFPRALAVPGYTDVFPFYCLRTGYVRDLLASGNGLQGLDFKLEFTQPRNTGGQVIIVSRYLIDQFPQLQTSSAR